MEDQRLRCLTNSLVQGGSPEAPELEDEMNIDELIERAHEADEVEVLETSLVEDMADALLAQQAEIAALMEELEQAWGERNEAVASKVNDEAMFMAQLAALKAELAAAHRAGMLAAAEIANKFEPDERDGVYFPSDAIREAAKK